MGGWEPRGRVGSTEEWTEEGKLFASRFPIPCFFFFFLPKKLSSKWLRKKILFLREYKVGQSTPSFLGQ